MRTIPAELAPTALDHLGLVMPSDELPGGPTRDLRRAMARFQDGDPHLAARATVEAALARLDPDQVATIAARRTRSLRDAGGAEKASALVPAAVVAEALAVITPDDSGERLVDLLVEVGDTVVAASVEDERAESVDAATGELHRLVEPHGDPVALISALHQTRGATGALIDGLLDGARPRPSAVPATKRTAADDLVLDGFGPIEQGETVAVALDLDTEFGHGRHACPGRRFAEAISAAVVAELAR